MMKFSVYVLFDIIVHFIIQKWNTLSSKVYKLRKLRGLSFWQNERREKPDISHLSANQFHQLHPAPEHNQNQHQEVNPLMELETLAWLKIQPTTTLHKTTTKNMGGYHLQDKS